MIPLSAKPTPHFTFGTVCYGLGLALVIVIVAETFGSLAWDYLQETALFR